MTIGVGRPGGRHLEILSPTFKYFWFLISLLMDHRSQIAGIAILALSSKIFTPIMLLYHTENVQHF